MFWFLRLFSGKKAEADVVTELPPTETILVATEPVAVPETSTLSLDEFDRYVELAERIGWNPDYITEERIRHFLIKKGTPFFPIDDVERFLDATFGVSQEDECRTWWWCPLREEDMEAGVEIEQSIGGNSTIDNSGWYQRRIPPSILEVIKKIHDEIPESLFFVSTMPEKEGETFLMVTGPREVKAFIIERWNFQR